MSDTSKDDQFAFDADNGDGQDGDAGQGTGAENQTVKDIRAAQRRAEGRAREAEKLAKEQATELAEYRTERKQATVTKVFTEAKIDQPLLAKMFLLENPSIAADAITKEAVTEYATKNGWQAPAADEGSGEEGGTGFSPVLGGNADAQRLGDKKVSPKELFELMATDPARANRLANSGMVDLEGEQPSKTTQMEFVNRLSK